MSGRAETESLMKTMRLRAAAWLLPEGYLVWRSYALITDEELWAADERAALADNDGEQT